MNSKRLLVLARWTAAFAVLAGIVLVYRRWAHVNPTTVALTLLLFILVLAAEWGLRYAVVLSLAATACYNFFFLPPIGTFVINDPQNWLALFAFLGVSVIASRLSARIREEACDARNRQAEVEILYRLSRELLETENVAELLNAIPGKIAQVANASGVLLFLTGGERVYRSAREFTNVMEVPQLRELAHLPSVTPVGDERSSWLEKSPVRCAAVGTRAVLVWPCEILRPS